MRTESFFRLIAHLFLDWLNVGDLRSIVCTFSHKESQECIDRTADMRDAR